MAAITKSRNKIIIRSPLSPRIKRDVGYHSVHPHSMAEHSWPGITQRG
jgi:hypothetical protein